MCFCVQEMKVLIIGCDSATNKLKGLILDLLTDQNIKYTDLCSIRKGEIRNILVL